VEQGKPYDDDGRSGLVFLNAYKRHWTSRKSHAALDYFKVHHRWIVGLLVAIAALKMR